MDIGIVTFMRRDKCRRLIHSIQSRYPRERITVADNGCRLPAKPSDIVPFYGAQTYIMPFDCGLSASRNFLLNRSTENILILDDDYEFTDETKLEDLQEVLCHDPDIGVVCGDAGMVDPPPIETRKTESRIEYQIVSVADNFQLVRHQLVKNGLRWNPELKLGEHWDWFNRVTAAGWKIARVPSVKVRHDREEADSPEYDSFRERAAGIKSRWDSAESPRSAVVFGVGHSGTTVLVRMLSRLGYHTGSVKEVVAENLAVQKINKTILSSEGICHCGEQCKAKEDGSFSCGRCGASVVPGHIGPNRTVDVLSSLPQPWVIKDPRMVLTLDRWMPALSKYRPAMILIDRELESMRRTYERHGYGDLRIYGKHVSELKLIAEARFKGWPWPKARLSFEGLTEAVAAFDLTRAMRGRA